MATKKVAKIVRPSKTQLHFNLCFIREYISIRSKWRWVLIIWAMSRISRRSFNFTIAARLTYINYNKKLCTTSPEAVVRRWSVKKLLLKLCRIHREIPESLFNKVAGLQICNFNKKRLQYRCFLVILRNI